MTDTPPDQSIPESAECPSARPEFLARHLERFHSRDIYEKISEEQQMVTSERIGQAAADRSAGASAVRDRERRGDSTGVESSPLTRAVLGLAGAGAGDGEDEYEDEDAMVLAVPEELYSRSGLRAEMIPEPRVGVTGLRSVLGLGAVLMVMAVALVHVSVDMDPLALIIAGTCVCVCKVRRSM